MPNFGAVITGINIFNVTYTPDNIKPEYIVAKVEIKPRIEEFFKAGKVLEQSYLEYTGCDKMHYEDYIFYGLIQVLAKEYRAKAFCCDYL